MTANADDADDTPTLRPPPLVAGELVAVTLLGTVLHAGGGRVLVEVGEVAGVRRPLRVWASAAEAERV